MNALDVLREWLPPMGMTSIPEEPIKPAQANALHAALADLDALVQAAQPFVEKWDLNAASYLADVDDGETRVLTARSVAEAIEDIKVLSAALSRVLGEAPTDE